MPDYVSIFCSHIKRIHEERGITKQELAALGGVSGSVITDLMQGKGNPTLKTMEGFAIGLSIPLPLLLKPLDSDEWKAILSVTQYHKPEGSTPPIPHIPQGYDLLDQVVLPSPKIEVIREWMNAPKRGRPRKK